MTVNFPNLLRLDGRGIVLLGAGQGIGEATARALAQAGARVLCVDKEGDLAHKVAKEVDGQPCVADVTKRPDMERVFKEARSAFGSVRGIVDIVGMAKLAPLSAFTDADYEWQFDVGLRHAFLALQLGAPLVAEGGGGAVTFVGSISGLACLPNEVVYSASKAALHHMARAAALEFGPRGVRVNAIAPGIVETPLTAQIKDSPDWYDSYAAKSILGRWAEPREMVGMVVYLASEASSYVTGAFMLVDGGWTAADGRFIPPL